MITLYSAPLSLFGKKVEIALAEKGLAHERILVPFSQAKGYAPKHPAVAAANPKAQVPVLVDGTLTLYDSTVIVEYLEDAYPAPPLLPKAADERARCRLLELFADEVMLPPLRALMHRNGPRPADPALWHEKEEKAVEGTRQLAGHFAELEARLAGRDWLAGPFTVADIACFLMVFYADRLAGPDHARHPHLAAWYGRMLKRPSVAAAVREILAADAELSEPVDGAYQGRGAPRV